MPSCEGFNGLLTLLYYNACVSRSFFILIRPFRKFHGHSKSTLDYCVHDFRLSETGTASWIVMGCAFQDEGSSHMEP